MSLSASMLGAAMQKAVAGSEPAPVDLVAGGQRVLAVPSHYRGGLNGVICVARAKEDTPFGEDERALLAGVANHVGIAIEQIANHKKLEVLSRTDELTGLPNRRAFDEEVRRRFDHLRRMRRSGALFYVDLDNFKQVNDVHGHGRGDTVLKMVADLLGRGSRSGDTAARLGGDEFALWLEEADQEAAVAKAVVLLDAARSLRRYSGSAEKPLGLSVGIAVSDPTADRSYEDLVHQADEAMYWVKHRGKGGYAVRGASGQLGGPDSSDALGREA